MKKFDRKARNARKGENREKEMLPKVFKCENLFSSKPGILVYNPAFLIRLEEKR